MIYPGTNHRTDQVGLVTPSSATQVHHIFFRITSHLELPLYLFIIHLNKQLHLLQYIALFSCFHNTIQRSTQWNLYVLFCLLLFIVCCYSLLLLIVCCCYALLLFIIVIAIHCCCSLLFIAVICCCYCSINSVQYTPLEFLVIL